MAKTPKGLLQGDKFSGRHTTLIPPALAMVQWLKDDPRVKKVVIGKITPVRGGRLGFRVSEEPGGAKVVVRSSNCVQELYFLADNPGREELLTLLEVIQEIDSTMVLR